MKRIGSILILLILAFSMVSQLWVFAEAKTIDLPEAYEGSYYHQEATIADVLAGTEYEQYTSMLVIAGIKLISGEVPPGLTYTYTKDAVVFKGTPTKTGKYSFTVEVTGRAPLMDMEETAEAIVNIEVKEGTPPDVPKEYETPKFITSPAEFYEVNRGGSLSIQVSAKCAEKCNFTLYLQNGSQWKAVAEAKNVNAHTFKPSTANDGTYNYKIVAVNAEDSSLKAEKAFMVKITSVITAPTKAEITGATEYSVGNALNLSCTADGTSPTYTWYIKRAGASSFTKLSSDTGRLLSIPVTSADNGAKIRCEVKNSAGQITSNEITITVKAAHVHSLGAWVVTKKPTCTAKGIETRSCACGESLTRDVPATGHTPASEWTIDRKQTCIASGVRSIRCVTCNDKVKEETIAATGHAFTEWTVIKSPTTTEDGAETRSCKNCNAKETQTIPKKDGTHNHAYTDWTVEKEATCTEDGLKSRSCACGYVQTATVSAEGHKYSAMYTVVTAPTCTTKGQKAKKCLGCNEYSERTDIEALGHSMGVWEVVIQPTYETSGLEVQKCTNAGCKYYVEKTIAKLVSNHTHMFSEWTISVVPGCTDKGTEKRTCSCGEIEENELDARGHTFGAWEVTLAPTATKDGVETRTCVDCEKAERRVVPKGSQSTLPDATPDVTPDTTPDNTPAVPETGDGTENPSGTAAPETGGGEGGGSISKPPVNPKPINKNTDEINPFVGYAILLALAVVLGVVVYCSIKIFLKNT